MDGDYYIMLNVPRGVTEIAPFLHELPIELEIGIDEASGVEVLVQNRVSLVAGFLCSKADGPWQTYDVGVSHKHSGDPDDVMRAFSRVLVQANLSHRIFGVMHELDQDEELVAYRART